MGAPPSPDPGNSWADRPPPTSPPPEVPLPPSPPPTRHPFPCSPETHPRRSRLPEAPKRQLGVGRPAHLVRSPGGPHEGAGPAEGGSGQPVPREPREPRGEPSSGPSDFLGAGEASAVQVEGVAWAGEPTWAGDLGQRAAEWSRELGGAVCM